MRSEAARLRKPRLVIASAVNHRNGLQTSLSPGILHKRLHTIHRHSKTAEEERGVNILFLALGFLRW
jgi:Protein of unknown function (DUF4011)